MLNQEQVGRELVAIIFYRKINRICYDDNDDNNNNNDDDDDVDDDDYDIHHCII